jgi:prophage tail gpP-like protein
MPLELVVAGKRYTGFTRAECTRRMDAICDIFSFDAVAEDGIDSPFQGGQLVQVFADGKKILTGFIEIVDISLTSDSHEISFSGRSRTGDLVDSQMPKINDISVPTSLKRVCEIVLEAIELDLEVIDEANPDEFDEKIDEISPEPGDGAGSFLEKLARKRQVLLGDDENGNLVIQKPSTTELRAFCRSHVRDETNNVIASQVSYDTTIRFNRYEIVSQKNMGAAAGAGILGMMTDTKAVVDQTAKVTDDEIRVGRRCVITGEGSYEKGSDGEKRAQWEADVRKARGEVYSCTVHGFTNQTGELWNPNTIPRVHDIRARVDGRRMLNSVTFEYSKSGSVTTLAFVARNAYDVELSEPKQDKKAEGVFGFPPSIT